MAGPSQGLAADARGLILSEDMVSWADGRDGGAAKGLVYRIAGQPVDDALSDSEDDEVRVTAGAARAMRPRERRCGTRFPVEARAH